MWSLPATEEMRLLYAVESLESIMRTSRRCRGLTRTSRQHHFTVSLWAIFACLLLFVDIVDTSRIKSVMMVERQASEANLESGGQHGRETQEQQRRALLPFSWHMSQCRRRDIHADRTRHGQGGAVNTSTVWPVRPGAALQHPSPSSSLYAVWVTAKGDFRGFVKGHSNPCRVAATRNGPVVRSADGL